MIKAFSSSLSLRMLGIFIVTAILVIIILIALFSKGLSGQWRRSIEPHLLQYANYVQQDLGSPPRPERAEALARRLPIDIHLYKDDKLIYSTSSQTLSLDQYTFKPTRRQLAKQQDLKTTNAQTTVQRISISEDNNNRSRLLRIQDGSYTIYYDLFQRRPKVYRQGRFNDELLMALAALAVVLGGSYLLIRRQLSPIRQIQKSVGIMASGQLDHRMDRQGSSDLDQLASSIDSMAQQIQAMLDAKRQLLMAISHELRSPVTRARITTELLPESKNRLRLLDDLQDMERMITDIMESEQLQTNHTILNKESLNPAELFANELQHLAPVFTLQTEGDALDFEGDPTRLRIMLRNLVLNAMQHGKNAQGDVELEVSLQSSTDAVVLRVSDTGPGIADAHINGVGDTFYRPDPSRSRATGGFGLGLSLARLIAEAHGGSLTITSTPETKPGTSITVTLPR